MRKVNGPKRGKNIAYFLRLASGVMLYNPFMKMKIGKYRQVVAQVMLLGSMAAGPGLAAASQELEDAIHREVERLTADKGWEVAVTVLPVSGRLSPCEDISSVIPTSSIRPGINTLRISCRQGARYRRVNIAATGSYVVSTRDIEPGELITADVLTTISGPLDTLPADALFTQAPAIGLKAKIGIKQSSPLRRTLLDAPKLIDRGDPVSILVKGKGFSIERKGVALDTGAAGDSIRLKYGRRQQLTAVVIGDGVAEIKL